MEKHGSISTAQLSSWGAMSREKISQALKHYVEQVQQGDPIYVALALFVAFFLVVGISYLQYHRGPATPQKKAAKQRSRSSKKKGGANTSGSSSQLTPSGDEEVQNLEALRKGKKSGKAKGDAGANEAVQAPQEEPRPADDAAADGEGWQVVTKKKNKKKAN
ncbi:hypothetical protein BESB_026740 [Besnoitia besnoiti]|uniref:Transmembrane protein n=1 Tax=Besnoitia besnoiti TaxID=94643 RepID=A0A2A9M8J0_BESBE|nr:uncharacterized protein BESB_026740 [Besnoitia besnoiti]PFH31700.1 hypothetical protein BESB_026740 [Besnoitia besnoiti]